MRAVAVFALATMGAMLAGAVSAVGLEAPPRAAAADLTLTIPLGRVGDEVAYDVQVAFFGGEYDYGLDATYQLVFRADGIHRIADQTGMLHDTVRLLWNRSTPDGGYWPRWRKARDPSGAMNASSPATPPDSASRSRPDGTSSAHSSTFHARTT